MYCHCHFSQYEFVEVSVHQLSFLQLDLQLKIVFGMYSSSCLQWYNSRQAMSDTVLLFPFVSFGSLKEPLHVVAAQIKVERVQ